MTRELAFAVFFISSATVPKGAGGQISRCGSSVDVYADWRRATLPGGGSDSVLKAALARWEPTVSPMRDPFTPLVHLNSVQLDSAKERRLWLDSLVMVVVDKFAPKELLVIPRDSMMFPFPQAPTLLRHLSQVAGAVRDAMLLADQRACNTSSARVFINPPPGLSVRQVHVHVAPTPPINATDLPKYYVEVEKQLRAILQRS